MTIVGCDFHPGWQQVAVFDPGTGEVQERKLANGDGEAEQFYRGLSPAMEDVACESFRIDSATCSSAFSKTVIRSSYVLRHCIQSQRGVSKLASCLKSLYCDLRHEAKHDSLGSDRFRSLSGDFRFSL
jgi:hypothetical protein